MKNTGKWIIGAIVLLVLGLIICGAVFGAAGFSFAKLGTVEFITKTYDVSGDFRNIDINADTEKITFVPSDNGKCRVECREEKDDPHSVSAQGDTLKISRQVRQRAWYFLHYGIVTETPTITVYLPDSAYASLTIDADTGDVNVPADFSFDSINIKLDTGDIRCLAAAKDSIELRTSTGEIAVSDISAADMRLSSDTGRIGVSDVSLGGNMDIRVDTGRVTMENVTCADFTSDGDTGRLVMTNVIASGTFTLKRTTGDIELTACDADTIYIRTDTGDVSGTLLSEKIFLTKSDTGKIDTPKSTTGGRCEIETDTGDIRIDIM